MKTLIVTIIIFMATICHADTNKIFEKLNVTEIKNKYLVSNDAIFGATKLSEDEFKKNVAETFSNDSEFVMLSDWMLTNSSECMAFVYNSLMYAICIDGKIVVLKEIK